MNNSILKNSVGQNTLEFWTLQNFIFMKPQSISIL